jgi:hypothetical protein
MPEIGGGERERERGGRERGRGKDITMLREIERVRGDAHTHTTVLIFLDNNCE